MRTGLLILALAAAIAAAPSGASASGHVPPPTPYQKGGGQALTVNGRLLPRDLVFRFIPVTLPLSEIRVTSLYGMRKHPVLGFNRMHRGVDFGGRTGTPAYSTAAGVVTFAGRKGSYGNLVEIQHGLGFTSRYGHLDSIDVAVGQAVDRNTQIGRVGATGRVTGPHLHYEIHQNGEAVDPVAFVIRAYELYRHLD